MSKLTARLEAFTKSCTRFPGTVLQQARQKLNTSYVYIPCLIVTIGFCLACLLWTPPPDVAIGALDAAGVIVALKGEDLQQHHRFVWALITLVLLVIEVKAIRDDRADQYQQHLQDLAQRNQQHLQDLAQRDQQFNTTLRT